MKVRTKEYRKLLMIMGLSMLAILLFIMIPLSYGISLPSGYWILQFLLFFLLISLVYINTNWLAPKFLFQKRFILYYSILFAACILIIAILSQTETWLKVPEAMQSATSTNAGTENKVSQGHSVSFYIFLVEVLVLGVNISGILINKWEDENEKRIAVEKEKIEMELSFLKSQINPHFFFNSLNTINALTYTNVEQSRNALKKLGKIMRYVLYNTSKEKTTLTEEIEFIENYLDLMKMRISNKVSLEFSTSLTNTNRKIAPMLFLPFIENCFKHGVSGMAESPIVITITDEGENVVFYAKNKLFERPVNNEAEIIHNHSIGIQNTKRRLELLYSNRYSLKINKTEGFEVLLKIKPDEN
ncbi:MAG: sensor histidine kinase [Bacteroidetes bacterium]|nr:sensor histidine kinase [Bacteroidota bacterium]